MNIELLGVIGFLALILVVGVIRGRNIENFEDYAVGKKKFSDWALVGSFVATIFGGAVLMNNLATAYKYGIPELFFLAELPLGFLFIGLFLAKRMAEFLPHLSIAASMGYLYGKGARVLTAIGGILLTIGKLVLEFYCLKMAVQTFFEVQGSTATIVVAMVVIGYAALGGARAVVATDFIQLLLFGLLLPALLLFMVYKMENLGELSIRLVADPIFKFKQLMPDSSNHYYLGYLDVFIFMLVTWMRPSTIQRIYMASNIWQVKRFFIKSIAPAFVLHLIIFIMGILLLFSSTNLDPYKLVDYIMVAFHFPALKILLFMSIVGLVMSTADSDLHAASVLFTHDILEPLYGKKQDCLPYKLIIARMATIVIGLFSLIVTINAAGQETVRALFFDLMYIYCSMVCAPFILALLGFRANKIAWYIGALGGVTTLCLIGQGVISKGVLGEKALLIFAGSLLFFMGSHYLLPKVPNTGWVGIKDKRPLLAAQQASERKWATRKETFENFKLSKYLVRLFPKSLATFFKVGLYADIAIVVALIAIHDVSYLSIFAPIMALATFFMFYPALQKTENEQAGVFMHYVWLMGLFILLFMVGTMVVGISGYAIVPTMVCLLNICVGFCVLPASVATVMALVAFFITQLIFPYQNVALIIEKWGSLGYFIAVMAGCCAFIKAIITSKKNEILLTNQVAYLNHIAEYKQKEELAESHYQHHFNRLTQDDCYEEAVIPKITKELEQITKDDMMLKTSQDTIKHLVDRLKGHKQFIEERIYHEQYHLALDDKEVTIQKIINNSINSFDKLGIRLQVVVCNNAQQKTMRCDPIKIERLFTDSLQLIQKSGMLEEEGIVAVHVVDTSIKYSLNEEGNFIKTLPAVAFIITTSQEKPEAETVYEELLDAIVPIASNDPNDLYKKEIVRIVDAHYGCFFADNTDTKIDFSYILPVSLNEIRDEVMNTLPPSPYFYIIETPESIKQEQYLEELLSKETTLKKEFVRETIQFMKKCHGDQRRKSGEPFYIHPMEVAEILLMETRDPDAIIAALLHDVIEDSKVFKSYIQSKYGSAVAEIVSTVTHMGDSFRKKKLTKQENEERLREFKDIRSVQVKMADRLHNVRTLYFRAIKDQVRVAKQTMEFYVPFAESVGVTKLTAEIRDRCEAILREHERGVSE